MTSRQITLADLQIADSTQRNLTDILGVDESGNAGRVSTLMLARQFGITGPGVTTQSFDSSSWITLASPDTRAFLFSTFDDAGNLTRTFNQADGRVDLFALSAAGLSAGPAMVLNYNNTSPANGDNIGHYAFRSLDPNGAANTNCYVLGNITAVSATAMSSKLTLGVMKSLNVGVGNGQPNVSMTIDGATSVVTFPTGFATARSGNVTSSAATGPITTYTNSANSRSLIVGVQDNFNGVINATGGGSLNLQNSSTTGISISSTAVDLPLPTQLRIEVISGKTTNYTLVTADGGKIFTTNGASGEVDFTLPTSPAAGYRCGFTVQAAQVLKVIAPTSNTINVGGSVSAAAGNITSSQVGAYVELEYFAGNKWIAKMATGSGGSSGAGGWTVT